MTRVTREQVVKLRYATQLDAIRTLHDYPPYDRVAYEGSDAGRLLDTEAERGVKNTHYWSTVYCH